MDEWIFDLSDKYERKLSMYERKHLPELTVVLVNLKSYMSALRMCDNPLLIKAGIFTPNLKELLQLTRVEGDEK